MLKEILENSNYDLLKFDEFKKYIEKLDLEPNMLISDNNDINNRKIVFSQEEYEKCELIL